MLPEGAFPAKLPNEHAHRELENEVRLCGTTALQSPDQFHNKDFVMPIFVFIEVLCSCQKQGGSWSKVWFCETVRQTVSSYLS